SILRTTLHRIKIRKRETLRRMPREGQDGDDVSNGKKRRKGRRMKKKVSFALTPEQQDREVFEKRKSFKEKDRVEMALLVQYALEIERRTKGGGVTQEDTEET